ncbi:hypothetical protein [Bacteroides graminisolvens]|nr:hypothetical protein [Bacteroides graminisolvens]
MIKISFIKKDGNSNSASNGQSKKAKKKNPGGQPRMHPENKQALQEASSQ